MRRRILRVLEEARKSNEYLDKKCHTFVRDILEYYGQIGDSVELDAEIYDKSVRIELIVGNKRGGEFVSMFGIPVIRLFMDKKSLNSGRIWREGETIEMPALSTHTDSTYNFLYFTLMHEMRHFIQYTSGYSIDRINEKNSSRKKKHSYTDGSNGDFDIYLRQSNEEDANMQAALETMISNYKRISKFYKKSDTPEKIFHELLPTYIQENYSGNEKFILKLKKAFFTHISSLKDEARRPMTFAKFMEKRPIHESFKPSFSGGIPLIPLGKNGELIAFYHGRELALVRTDSFGDVLYYKSTGSNPKDGVREGKWYPVHGIANNGWIIKGGDVGIFYGKSELKKFADKLNSKYPEVRNWDHSGAEPKLELIRKNVDSNEDTDGYYRELAKTLKLGQVPADVNGWEKAAFRPYGDAASKKVDGLSINIRGNVTKIPLKSVLQFREDLERVLLKHGYPAFYAWRLPYKFAQRYGQFADPTYYSCTLT